MTSGHEGGHAFNEDQRSAMRSAAAQAESALRSRPVEELCDLIFAARSALRSASYYTSCTHHSNNIEAGCIRCATHRAVMETIGLIDARQTIGLIEDRLQKKQAGGEGGGA